MRDVAVISFAQAKTRRRVTDVNEVEMLMPVVQPAELWRESRRWDEYGPELLRLKDRHERDFVMQPTSEEVITELARGEHGEEGRRGQGAGIERRPLAPRRALHQSQLPIRRKGAQ